MKYKSIRPPSLRAFILALLIALGFTGAVACEEKKSPMEEIGDAIDEGARDTKRAVEDATD